MVSAGDDVFVSLDIHRLRRALHWLEKGNTALVKSYIRDVLRGRLVDARAIGEQSISVWFQGVDF